MMPAGNPHTRGLDEQPIYFLTWVGRRSEFRTFARIIDNLGGCTVVITQRGQRRFGLEFHACPAALARIRAVFAATAVDILV
jgi:hypothetical protein